MSPSQRDGSSPELGDGAQRFNRSSDWARRAIKRMDPDTRRELVEDFVLDLADAFERAQAESAAAARAQVEATERQTKTIETQNGKLDCLSEEIKGVRSDARERGRSKPWTAREYAPLCAAVVALATAITAVATAVGGHH
jgi:hypothetical protein